MLVRDLELASFDVRAPPLKMLEACGPIIYGSSPERFGMPSFRFRALEREGRLPRPNVVDEFMFEEMSPAVYVSSACNLGSRIVIISDYRV